MANTNSRANLTIINVKLVWLVLLVTTMLLLPVANNATGSGSSYRVKTVVIDAGHGGHDPGALGASKVREKNVCLAVALKVGAYIKENFPDVKVIFTRDKDEFIELHERGAIANRNKADLFISIHCNSSQATTASGTEIWVLGLHKTEEQLAVAKRENSVILMESDYQKQYDGFDPNSPESNLIFTIYQDAYIENSIKLASMVNAQFKNGLHRSTRGVKQAGFLVLWKAAMPSMLIELGFITNKKEETFLNSEQGRNQMAGAIYRAFKQYKMDMEPGVHHDVKDKGIPEQPKGKGADVSNDDDDSATTDADTVEEKAPAKTPEKNKKPEPTKGKPPVKGKTADDTKPKATKKPVDPNKLVFRVQILASKTQIALAQEPKLKLVEEYDEEQTDYFRYYAGSFETLPEASTYAKALRALGFQSAFVVAFKGSEKLTPQQMKELK